MHGSRNTMPAISSDRNAVEGNSQVIPHCLYPVVVFPVQPRENSIAWEEVSPFLEAFCRFDADLCCSFHYRSAGIRREDVGPEFSARIPAANIHNEAHGFSPFYFSLSRVAEYYVE